METVSLLLERLEELNEIGVSLSRERDITCLLERILSAAKRITGADGGTLYRVSEDGAWLHFAIVHNTSLGLRFGGVGQKDAPFNPIPLRPSPGVVPATYVAAHCALTHETVNLVDVYADTAFDFTGAREFDRAHAYRSQSFLAVPLVDHDDEVIGVLQLVNALDGHSGAPVPFSPASQRLAESLASQAVIALSNRLLITQQQTLFESLIGLINSAIDDKSPYTGAHCQRVPALTMMLADAVAAKADGPFADFGLNDDERYELHIASLLHDCGKITTPVHVIDKATKLQTIFDRIDLVDARFEVLRRDAEIAALRAALATEDGQQRAQAAAPGASVLRALDADQEFLRAANIGMEKMPEDAQQRVRDIAARWHWTPAGGAPRSVLTEDELENLCIRSGTLTSDERQIINRHIDVTIQMLESLPWMKSLRRVPEYAGGHHERMDGRGYPRGLTREDMSVPARMIGIADIFEALTADDRPYKSGKLLSEALRILDRMSDNGHVDPDLFDIFIESGIWQKYAEGFLPPLQRDAVDVTALAGYQRRRTSVDRPACDPEAAA